MNYKITPMDNISWRAEYFDDINGQRTGTKTSYFNYAMGWQHWFSPTVEIRPEIAWYNSLNGAARFADGSAPLLGGVGTKSHIAIFSARTCSGISSWSRALAPWPKAPVLRSLGAWFAARPRVFLDGWITPAPVSRRFKLEYL